MTAPQLITWRHFQTWRMRPIAQGWVGRAVQLLPSVLHRRQLPALPAVGHYHQTVLRERKETCQLIICGGDQQTAFAFPQDALPHLDCHWSALRSLSCAGACNTQMLLTTCVVFGRCLPLRDWRMLMLCTGRHVGSTSRAWTPAVCAGA